MGDFFFFNFWVPIMMFFYVHLCMKLDFLDYVTCTFDLF